MSVPYVCVQKEMALVGFSFYNNCRLFHPQNVCQCHIEHIILLCVSNIPVIKMGDNNNSNCYFHSNSYQLFLLFLPMEDLNSLRELFTGHDQSHREKN